MRHFTLNLAVCLLLLLSGSQAQSFGIEYRIESGRDELIPLDSYFNSESIRTKRERLSLLVKEMSSRPNDVVYIVAYGNLAKIDCEGIENLKFAREFLSRQLKIRGRKIVYVNGGYLTKGMTEIFLLPRDVKFPIPKLDFNDFLE